MRRKSLCMALCLLLCIAVCTLTGCKKGTEYNEDSSGTTTNTQATVSNTVRGYYETSGMRYYDPNVLDDREPFKTFLHSIEDAGTGITFDYDSVAPSEAGYSVSLLTPLDGWGHSMLLYIESESATAKAYHITVVSPGRNNEFNSGGFTQAESDEDSDDVRFQYTNERPPQ